MPLVAIAAAAAVGFWLLLGRKAAVAGPGPFDKMPAGVKGVAKVAALTAAGGRVYKLHGFPINPSTGQAYVVAQLQVPNAAPGKVPPKNVWISYWQAPAGVKSFVQANASGESQLQQLISDLGVVR